MLIRALIILVTFLVYNTATAEDKNCMHDCIATGGLAETCTTKCGLSVSGSVNMEKTASPKGSVSEAVQQALQPRTDKEQSKKDFEECYAEQCKSAKSSLPLEQCIENCAKVSLFEKSEGDSSGGTNVPGSRDGEIPGSSLEKKFKVDQDCMKICAIEGEKAESCQATCKKF